MTGESTVKAGARTRKSTSAPWPNLSSLPIEQIELLQRVLRGEALVPVEVAFQIVPSERDLTPILFTDLGTEDAPQRKASVVAPASRAPAAKEKLRSKRTEHGFPIQSFRPLMKNLATLTKNTVSRQKTLYPVRCT